MLEWLILFLKIMMINMVLSGDNAIVIAMASKNLPLRQRKQAVWWGAAGAIGLRLVLTVIAVYLLKIAYIQAIGSFLLFYIAIKLLVDDEGHTKVKEASSLGKAIWTIIVADFVMSLDNVLAIAAAAQGNVAVIILGIALSIPIIVWGSTLVMQLLHKYPILVYLGAGILGYTAGEMFVSDEKMQQYVLHDSETAHWLIPVLGMAAVIAVGIAKKIRSPHAKKW